MKKIMIILLGAVLGSPCHAGVSEIIDSVQGSESNAVLTATNFFLIKDYILRKGERKTYGTPYSNNPYAKFGDVEVFLNPDDVLSNLTCDIRVSDFNSMCIRFKNKEYYFVESRGPGSPDLTLKQCHQSLLPDVALLMKESFENEFSGGNHRRQARRELRTKVENFFRTILNDLSKKEDTQSNKVPATARKLADDRSSFRRPCCRVDRRERSLSRVIQLEHYRGF